MSRWLTGLCYLALTLNVVSLVAAVALMADVLNIYVPTRDWAKER